MNCEIPDFKLDLEKAEEPEIKLPTSIGSLKKQESSRKTSTSLLTTSKALTMWITINCGKFLKREEYQTTWPASWEKKKALTESTTVSPVEISGIITSHYSCHRYPKSSFMFVAFFEIIAVIKPTVRAYHLILS